MCENADPVAELRRIYNAISQTLGYRTLQQYSGGDVWQLKVMLHALGYFHATEQPLTRGADANIFTPETVAAVDAFRAAEQMGGPAVGSPTGLVDAEMVGQLWAAVERAGKTKMVRQLLRDVTAVRR